MVGIVLEGKDSMSEGQTEQKRRNFQLELSLRDKTNMNEGQTPLEIKKNGRHPLKKKNGRKMFGRGK